jgi:replicative DNA helicase
VKDESTREAEYTFLSLLINQASYAIPGIAPEIFSDHQARALVRALQAQLMESPLLDGLAAARESGISAYDYVEIINRSYGTNVNQWEFIVKGNFLNRELDRLYREAQSVPDGLDRMIFIQAGQEKALAVVGGQGYTEDSHEQFMDMLTREVPLTRTGIPVLDRWFGGFEDGDFILIAARPSVGKTAFGTTLAFDMARGHNIGVDYHSYEMSGGRIRRRVVARLTRIENKRIRLSKTLTPDELNECVAATEKIKHFPVRFLGSSGLGISALVGEIHRTKAKVVMVDYLGLVPASITGEKREQVTDVSNKLRDAAKNSGKVVIALVQMNRDVEKSQREPVLSDLRDSGDLEQDADFVFFIHEKGRKENLDRRLLDVEIKFIGEKMRDADVGWQPLRFAKPYSHFYDPDTRRDAPPDVRYAHQYEATEEANF